MIFDFGFLIFYLGSLLGLADEIRRHGWHLEARCSRLLARCLLIGWKARGLCHGTDRKPQPSSAGGASRMRTWEGFAVMMAPSCNSL